MANPLRSLMLRHGLSRRDVARLLGKPLNSARGQSNSTVDSWLSGKTPMPPLAQELLKLKLRGRKPTQDPWQRLLTQPLPYASQRELETDLAEVLKDIRQGQLPDLRKFRAQPALRRAGYLFELTSHFGGPVYERQRTRLQARAQQLRARLTQTPAPVSFRADDKPRECLMDDLAARWKLAAGTDVRRFRQLARTGHV
jgi:transcriptional regulator with XRE-family HTH domain